MCVRVVTVYKCVYIHVCSPIYMRACLSVCVLACGVSLSHTTHTPVITGSSLMDVAPGDESDVVTLIGQPQP